MSGDRDDAVTVAAASAAGAYGMTAEQALAYVALGDRRHGDAPAGECGAVDPRDEGRWCRLPDGHAGDHNRYLPEQLADLA